MTQPDLVSKLKEVKAALQALIDPADCSYDHHGYCQAHAHFTAGLCPQYLAKQALLAVENQPAESLLGLEGQAAELSGAVQVGISTRTTTNGPCYDPLQPSPSTPIVPSTPDDPRFNGVVVEVAEEFAILDGDIPTLREILARLQLAAGLSAEQVASAIAANKLLPDPPGGYDMEGIAKDLNALLGAAKPASAAILTGPDGTGIGTGINAERPAPAGEVRSGWEQGYDKAIREALEAGLPQLEWANIHGSRCEELLRWVKDLLRLSPAGEVRISRWQCPHCAHVNLMTSANCENCKIPLVNTAGEVKGEK